MERVSKTIEKKATNKWVVEYRPRLSSVVVGFARGKRGNPTLEVILSRFLSVLEVCSSQNVLQHSRRISKSLAAIIYDFLGNPVKILDCCWVEVGYSFEQSGFVAVFVLL